MDFFEVVHTQRSIRRFKPDPVPDDLLWKVLDAAIRAPSGSNQQPWAWLVVRDRGRREAVSRQVRERLGADGIARMRQMAQSMQDPVRRRSLSRAADLFSDVGHAPVLVIPCLTGVTSPVSDARSLFAGSSIYGAVQNMMLAARALGLGTVLTTFNIGIEDWLRKEFGLPGPGRARVRHPHGLPGGPALWPH